MTESSFSFNNFLSKIRGGGLAHSNRFEVEIFGPNSFDNTGNRNVSILCEDAAVPGAVLDYTPIKIGNWIEPRTHNLNFFGDNATFTFFCDSGWDVRAYFENWIFSSVDPVSKEVSFQEDIRGSAVIHALSREDTRVASWVLEDVLPRNLSLTNLTQGNEAPVRVTMSLQYRHWRPGEYTNPANPTSSSFINISS